MTDRTPQAEKKRRQGGFTLIEIIAVLVLLGILAAVAIPRYLDMQDDARAAALQGALAAAMSQVQMEYARALLNGGSVGALSNVEVGDFQFSSTAPTDGEVTVTITSVPTGWPSDSLTKAGTKASSTFKLISG